MLSTYTSSNSYLMKSIGALPADLLRVTDGRRVVVALTAGEEEQRAGRVASLHDVEAADRDPSTTATGSARTNRRRIAGAKAERIDLHLFLESLSCGFAIDPVDLEERIERHTISLPRRAWPGQQVDRLYEEPTTLFGWRRQIGHQTHRDTQLVELEVRPEERNGAVHARLAADLPTRRRGLPSADACAFIATSGRRRWRPRSW